MDVILGLEESCEATPHEDKPMAIDRRKMESSAMDNKVFEKDEEYESHVFEEAVTESNRGE